MKQQNKEEAMAIVRELERNVADIEANNHDADVEKNGMARTVADSLLGYASKRFSGADPDQAVLRAQELKTKHPELNASELVEKLIKAKCQKTATIGATTSAASIIPGIGTALSLTVGLAVDVSSTLKLHSELVLEIAEAHGHQLTETERSEVILAVTGLSTGISRLGGKAVKGLSHKVGEMAAQKWLAKAVPAIGMAASASTNVLSTYIVGQRANAYFARGPEAMGDLKNNLRALSGVDERKIAQWVSETSRTVALASAKTGSSIAEGGRWGVGHVADVGRKAGKVVSSIAEKVSDTGKTTGNAILSGKDKASGMISHASRTVKDTVGNKAAKTVSRVTAKKQKPKPSEDEEDKSLK